MEEEPGRIIVTSLTEEEAHDAISALRKDYPGAGEDFFLPWWGNIFVREELKDLPRAKILKDARYRKMLIDDTVGGLPGKKIVYIDNYGGGNIIYGHHVLVAADSTVYDLGFAGFGDHYDAYAAVYDASLNKSAPRSTLPALPYEKE